MGNKLIVFVILIIGIFIIQSKKARAEAVAGNSAMTKVVVNEENLKKNSEYLLKKKVLQSVLELYESSLIPAIDSFLYTCTKYKLDCYLLPSIAGVESYFGKYLVQGSYNPFGWGGGYIYFKNFDEAIDTVAAGLRNNYIDKGADTIDKIGPIYAVSTTWSPKVRYFVDKFQKEEEKYRLFFKNGQVKL